MATLASHQSIAVATDNRFFRWSAYVMTALIILGFSTQVALGRSRFASPPLVHAHAIVFMGWVGLYLAQSVLATTGSIALHRRLGWLAALWIPAMLVLGCMVTVAIVQRGQVPFFFTPLQFLVFDPLTLFTFAALSTAAIVLRRHTGWHRRLHFSGMAILMGPAIGRLIPLPLLSPLAFEATLLGVLAFPVAGIIADQRRSGSIHPAWTWGLVAILGSTIIIEAITYSPLGTSLYTAITDGTPGAAVAPHGFPAPPGMPITK
ncbi:hypothetical protein GCM10007973_09390 [Polymorphobacter multimanifer]|uniref:hypothetical protein n=1 Tax=Polymorphobacter multimanifer TaxID=1070431 RepID=UPI0019CB7775|nr:hypothetical protein [Polymorphobacter multimanifer]GGI74633.1 hypothetical protein GCM10007973_09390 [Polymorphobacter multimanifer]